MLLLTVTLWKKCFACVSSHFKYIQFAYTNVCKWVEIFCWLSDDVRVQSPCEGQRAIMYFCESCTWRLFLTVLHWNSQNIASIHQLYFESPWNFIFSSSWRQQWLSSQCRDICCFDVNGRDVRVFFSQRHVNGARYVVSWHSRAASVKLTVLRV